MAAGSGALNLSLLSRGVGEVKRNGTERVDVIFEPQDYFNFVEESQERPFFLPPLQPRYGFSDGSQVSSRPGPKEHVYLPKTFTTRKGALLLFSEDMAHKTKQEAAYKKHRTFDIQSKDRTLSTMTASSLDHDLKTVDDLAKSILAYGSIDETGKMNLKFLHQKRKYDFDRQIRPGFSAKRYLSTWTKNWDDNVLEKVISKGYLTEKSLFYYNPLLPHLSRRLNDDMSHYPTPYKLMRSMLMSPGSLSGYTFYRVRPESQETDYIEISDEDDGTQARSAGGRSAHDRSVKLLSVTADGGQKEISYGTLDARQQKEVLTDLLVKSAVHYALKKQQEYVLDANRIDEEGSEYNPMPKFDMKDAVETMLSDNDKKSVPANVIEADLPERDDRSQHSGSFKGSKLGHSARLHPAVKERGSSEALLSINTQDDAHIPTSPDALPPLPTGHSVLPPIGQTYTQLTPIGEASREHTTAFSLPVDKDGDMDSLKPQVNVIPATPLTEYSTKAQTGAKGVPRDSTFELGPTAEQPEDIGGGGGEGGEGQEEEEEKWAGRNVTEKESHVPRPPKEPVEEKRRRDADKRKGTKIPQHSLDLDGPVITGGPHLMSSSESLGPGSTQSSALGWQHRQPQWKGSTQSLRSQGSRKASGSVVDGDVGSTKGSIVFGPDGAVIKVGETIKLSARASEGVQDVQDANMYPTGLRDASDDSDGELPDEWRQKRRADSVQRYGRKEIDYHSGDIDATLSIHSWSYGYRDDVNIHKADSVRSLPILSFDRGDGLEPEKEVWEGMRPSSFIAHKSDAEKIAQSQQFSSASGKVPESPERSKSEISISPKTPVLQRSHTSPVSDRSEKSFKSRSRPGSDASKSHRPLLSQLNQMEVEAEIIREQTEISHITEPVQSELSKMSEKGDADTVESEVTKIQEDIEEEKDEVTEQDIKDVVKEEEDGAKISDLDDGEEEKEADEDAEKTLVETGGPSPAGSQKGDTQTDLDSPKSHVTEQEIIDTLTSHASRIAESVLSQSDGGQVLEEDIRRAAALWMETHPARDISRSQSVQEIPDQTMIHDVMKAQKRNSAGPTVAEYRDQIRGNLMTAIAKAAGIDQSEIPADAEIDPELMEQLSSQNLTPGDIEIVRDEETGRSFIRSRNRQISEAMGGVEKGHIYQSGGKGDANKRISIPERKQNVDIGELDVIKYGEADKLSQKSPSEKAGSEVGSKKGSVSGAQSLVAGSQHDDTAGSKTPKSAVSFKDDKQEADEFQKAIEDLERSSTKKSEGDALSEKSDDKKSKVSEKGKKKEEFVVGKVKENKELELLYGQPDLPVKKETTEIKKSAVSQGSKQSKSSREKSNDKAGPIDHTKENTKIYPGLPPTLPAQPRKPKAKPKAPVKPTKKPKKGKGKGKKKEEEVAPEPETAIEATSPVKEPTPEPVAPSEPPKEPTPPPPESEPSPEPEYESPKPEESEDEGDYIIVRDQSFSPEPESVTRANVTTSPEEEPEEEQVSQDDIDDDMSEADKLRLISNREARAAKRAAAAEKRRQEVERKRREREEQLKKEKEEQERQEKLKVELEEQRKRKEEERRLERLKKQREEEENEAAIREEVEQQRRAAAEAEKERRRKEEYARKLEEMKKRQAEEEQKRREDAERKRLEEEERKRQEEELMAQMEEEERLEYERKRKEEEEERKRKEEEEKRLREEEAQRALEEARRLAEEMARRQAELEARLRFNRSLQLESNGLEHTQDITKAFVFSYFELLQWLGLDIPEFELLKLNQY